MYGYLEIQLISIDASEGTGVSIATGNEGWEPESLKLLEEVSNYSTRHCDAATGLETWFNLSDLKTAVAPLPRWKMIIVISSLYIVLSLYHDLFLTPS